MIILYAAAAFSVLMIVFSTIVASITESYLRITAIRADVLSQSVLAFLRNDPTVARFLGRIGKGADDSARKALADRLTRNINYAPYTDYLPLRGKGRVERLSTFSFLQRLAATELGKEIAKTGEETALRSLTMGFERYVTASNEVFRKRAQAISMALSLAFALVVNINAPLLFSHLMKNPLTSAELIAQGETVAQENAEALARLETAITALENPEVTETELTDALASSRALLGETQDQIAILANELPVGWGHYPHAQICMTERSPDGCVFNGHSFKHDALVFGKWLAGTLLAGFLIGLGGPFWYRVFASLSHVFQLLRSFGAEPRKEAIEANATTNQPASQNFVDAVLNSDKMQSGELLKMFRASTGMDPAEFKPQ